jgi:D-alanyl-lipoteichoic acid acyltransferase DltB (MBOAT superfamily)
VSGFWHGANWTFIIWGAYHAALFMPLLLIGKNRKNTNIVAENRKLPSLKEFASISLTFILVTIGWIIFRADNIHIGFEYIQNLFSSSILSMPTDFGSKRILSYLLIMIPVLIFVEWKNRKEEYGLKKMHRNKVFRWSLYIVITFVIIEMGGAQQEFIYFQF